MATDGDALAMRRPSPLTTTTTTGAQDDKVTTPKKQWMLRWRLQTVEPPAQEQIQSPQASLDQIQRVEAPQREASGRSLSPAGTTSHPPETTTTKAPPPTASISPSAKTKDPSETTVSRTASPVKILQEQENPETEVAKPPVPVRTTSTSSDVSTATSTDSLGDEPRHDDEQPETAGPPEEDPLARRARPHDDKPPLEPTLSVRGAPEAEEAKPALTESERHRLERRKRRKTNWDVGDPRKHGGSLDLAALNLLSSINPPATHPASFAKFPRQRPAYRHSHSLDARGPASQRSPVFGNNTAALGGATTATASLQSPPRRAFHHSASFPLDRPPRTSRPPPSSSSSFARYPPGNGAFR